MANDKTFIVKNGLTANTIALVDNVSSPANTINITMDGANDKLVISGDAGELLTVTDANTGTLFAVANSSGQTVFSVDDAGVVTGNVGATQLSGLSDVTVSDGDIRVRTTNGDDSFYALWLAGQGANTSSSDNVAIGYYAYRNEGGAGGLGNVNIGSYAGNNPAGTASTASYNVDVGYQAGYDLTTGSYNTLLGYQAGYNITTGANNIMIGRSSGLSITTGNENIAIGASALRDSNSSGAIAIGNDAGLTAVTTTDAILIGQSVGNGGGTVQRSIGIGAYSLGGNYASANGANNVAIGYVSMAALGTGYNNIAIGENSLRGNTTSKLSGAHNIGMGDGSGYNLSTGNYNFYAGNDAGNGATTGSFNVGIGYRTLFQSTTAGDNIAIGAYAFEYNSNGGRQYSVAIGRDALNRGADNGVAIGYRSARYATGGNNIALGREAMQGSLFNTTGFQNVTIGSYSATALTSGSYNSLVGEATGQYLTSGYYNVALGHGALRYSDTANNNVAIGAGALSGNTSVDRITGENNIGIGRGSGAKISTGANNTIIGHSSGGTIRDGSENIIIGAEAEPSSANASNEITLGNASITRLRIPGLDLDTASASDGQVLAWNTTTGGFVWTTASSGGAAVTTSNAEPTSPSDGDLWWDTTVGELSLYDASANNWIAVSSDPGAYSINGLVDAFTNETSNNMSIGVGTPAYTTGANNLTIGYGAGDSITTGNNNVMIGIDAGTGVTSAANTVYIGAFAGSTSNLSTDTENVAIGAYAMQNATNNRNVAIGGAAMQNSTSAQSVAIGWGAGASTGLSHGSVFIGYQAKGSGTTESRNSVVIGYQAAQSGCGNNNIIIGYAAYGSSGTATDEITIGNSTHNRLRIPGLDLDTNSAANGQMLIWNTSTVGFEWVTPVTASSTTTFTNKSGNISQWTNDSGYVTSDTNTTYDLVSPGTTGVLRLSDSANANDDITFTGSGATTVTSNSTHIIISSTDTNTDTNTTYNLLSPGSGVLRLQDSSNANDNITFTGSGATSVSSNATHIIISSTDTDTVYSGWNLLSQGTSRGSITSGENVDFYGGATISTAYSATNNRITFNVTDNSIGADQLNVSGNGTAGQALLSDGDGSFSWGDAGASVAISTTAPSGPSAGDLWWDSDTGELMIYYNDGTSSQWVEASPNPNPFTYDSGSSTFTLTGNLTVTGDLNSNSDETLKQNINTFEGGLEAVKSMRGVRYEWKESGKSSIGLIAQEVEKILPELVATGEDDIKSIQYGNIVAVLIEAVKELSARVEELENK